MKAFKRWQSLKRWRPSRAGLKRHGWKWGLLGGLLLSYGLCLPDPLFEKPVSVVLEDEAGQLLGARIAADGQWRFPPMDRVPESFAQAIITFEDKRFYRHPGIDPLALGRALRLNLEAGSIVSGGSTLSMQVIRLSRNNPPRNLWQKFLELILVTRLELRYSKAEILALYASHAPFGGNVVGLEAAAWKYYGRRPDQLSWAEAATLAVLPNAPGLIHPGRNRDALEAKRNRLLDQMLAAGIFQASDHQLAKLEALPGAPRPLPMYAPHLLDRVLKGSGTSGKRTTRFRSTLKRNLQRSANQVVERHHLQLQENGIQNAGALIVHLETGAVLAYVGNTRDSGSDNGNAVDVIPAWRSTGSILKPLLYASMLQGGELLPKSLVADVPTYFAGYHPTNFDQRSQGAVPANRALSRSLNVPAVRMLRAHGVTRFAEELRGMGLSSLVRPSEDYGLSLILGGAEASLWELTGVYASMGRIMQRYGPYDGRYDPQAFRPPVLEQSERYAPLSVSEFGQLREDSPLGAGAIWHTLEAMLRVSRPESEGEWEQFSSSERVAWKTGTSYGYRDAWAIGLSGEYAIGVWVGNADGEGRPGLIGGKVAAPILFDLFDLLPPQSAWFDQPYDDLRQVPVCRQSGHRAAEICPDQDSVWIPTNGLRSQVCSYHQLVSLDPQGQFRVNSDCLSPLEMKQQVFFRLPPTQENYYRNYHPSYQRLPTWRSDCQPNETEQAIALIYPRPGARLLLPVNLDGSPGKVVLQAASQISTAVIYWHLDEQFLGETKELHQISIQPSPGKHVITLVTEQGELLICPFEVLASQSK
jgi:penicillin-binding protein 1C